MHRYWTQIILFAALLPVFRGSVFAASYTLSSLPDETILAEVDGSTVTVGEVRRSIASIGCIMPPKPLKLDDFLPEIEQEIVEDKVNRILMMHACDHDGHAAAARLDADREFVRRLELEFEGDAHRMADFLDRARMSEFDYRNRTVEDMVLRHVRKIHSANHPPVSVADAQRHYELNRNLYSRPEGIHLNMILLKPTDSEDLQTTSETAMLVMAELLAGTPFQELAREFSKDSRSEQGGDWGWISRNDLRTELAEVAFDLEPGEFSEPIQVRNEIFILRAVGKRPAGTALFAEVRDEILQHLTRMAEIDVEKEWIENLRAKASIVYFDHADVVN